MASKLIITRAGRYRIGVAGNFDGHGVRGVVTTYVLVDGVERAQRDLQIDGGSVYQRFFVLLDLCTGDVISLRMLQQSTAMVLKYGGVKVGATRLRTAAEAN